MWAEPVTGGAARPQTRLVLEVTARLARTQGGVALRSQLQGRGLTDDVVRAQVAAGRWQWWGHHVVVLHNAELSRRQLMWACVLDAGPGAALASHTALQLAGFRSFAQEAEQIHLVIGRGAKVHRVPDVVVHESRRLEADRHVRWSGLPCTPLERSAIDAAAWQRWPASPVPSSPLSSSSG